MARMIVASDLEYDPGLTQWMCHQAEDGIKAAVRTREHLESQVERLLKGSGDFLQRYRVAMLTQLLEGAIGRTGADMGNIQIFDPASGVLRIEAHSGFRQPFLRFFASVRDGTTACGMALKRVERVVIQDVTDSEIFFHTPALEVMLDAGARAVQSTPLICSGRVWGMLSTHYRTPRLPSQRDLHLLDDLAHRAACIIERHSR